MSNRRIVLVNSFNMGDLVMQAGVLSLASTLDQAGHQVKIVDFNYAFQTRLIDKSLKVEEIVESMAQYVMDHSPKIVGFSSLCSDYHLYIEVALKLKKIDESVKIIFGGPQASVTSEESIRNFPWIDAIAIGAYEEHIVDLVECLLDSKKLDKVDSLVYFDKKVNKVVVRSNSKSRICAPRLKKYELLPYINEVKVGIIEAGRGCVFKCKYCSTSKYWKRKYLFRDPKEIVDEIEFLYRTFGIEMFSLQHDLFTINRQNVIEFCQLLMEKSLPVKWACSSRVDAIDEDLVNIMIYSGCVEIFVGIETGSQDMQSLIHKNLDLNEIIRKFEMLKLSGIEKITTSFMYGFPEEKFKDLNDTMVLISKMMAYDFVSVNLYHMTYLAGTEYYNEYERCLEIDVSSHSGMNVSLFSDTSIKLIESNKAIFPHFYKVKGDEDKYEKLDDFVNIILPNIKKDFPVSFRVILGVFRWNVLDFFKYIYIHKISLEGIKKYSYEAYFDNSNSGNYRKGVRTEIHNIMKLLAHTFTDDNENRFISELIIYEHYLYKVYSSSELMKGELNCNYDVFQIKSRRLDFRKCKELGLDNAIIPHRIEVIKDYDNRIRVRRSN